jgi:hypothetical protein
MAGDSVDVQIVGTGFEIGANVELANGAGKQPNVSNMQVVDDNNITATTSTSSGGPPRDRTWAVNRLFTDGVEAHPFKEWPRSDTGVRRDFINPVCGSIGQKFFDETSSDAAESIHSTRYC